jgi:hypothetical protein
VPDTPRAIRIEPKVLAACVGTYRLAPGLMLTCTRDGDRLIAQLAGQKLPLHPVSQSEFIARETTFRCRFEGSGKDKEKVSGRLGAQEFSGRRVQRAELTKEQLADYRGDFYSPELRVLYTVAARDGKLRVRVPRGEHTLRAWEGDEFTPEGGAPFSTLQFARGEDRRVTGFAVSTSRLRNLRFHRVDLRPKP